ncbi:hypothetical protein ACFQ3N_11865 [Virgibacillus byunsanensis]|uniref:DUF1292 domain-containing protein n=1 Tax=Virgibacillus byunsanensis TaxID=570945 RepID=A0ABW3LNL6_9BACI
MSIFDDETLKLLDEPQALELEKDFNQFYIVTYEIEDLSEFIGTSTVNFDEGDYEVLVEDGFDVPDTPAAVYYDIVPEDELNEDDGEGEGN